MGTESAPRAWLGECITSDLLSCAGRHASGALHTSTETVLVGPAVVIDAMRPLSTGGVMPPVP